MIKRGLIFVHRWLGVTLCLVFLLWFPSGIGMMYWDYPTVSPGDRLDHAPALDASKIALSPAEAADKIGTGGRGGQIRITRGITSIPRPAESSAPTVREIG